jgi:hypothetical protein
MITPDTSTDNTESTRRNYCCGRADKHLAAFIVRVMFGFFLAAFCMAGLVYEMVEGGSRTEFIAMYFSLLSFAAGYFLGATPGIKRPAAVPTTVPTPPQSTELVHMMPAGEEAV